MSRAERAYSSSGPEVWVPQYRMGSSPVLQDDPRFVPRDSRTGHPLPNYTVRMGPKPVAGVLAHHLEIEGQRTTDQLNEIPVMNPSAEAGRIVVSHA